MYVNPVYDIADFYAIFNKQNELIKLKLLVETHMEEYMERNDVTEEEYVERMTKNSRDAPKQKVGLFTRKFVERREIKKQIKELQDKIEAMEKVVDDRAFTGIVFIVLDRPQEVGTVLKR